MSAVGATRCLELSSPYELRTPERMKTSLPHPVTPSLPHSLYNPFPIKMNGAQ